MYPNHDIRQTARKIAARLALIAPLVYRQSFPLQALRYKELSGPLEPPPLDPTVDDSDWKVLPAGAYWGGQNINFVLCGEFRVPAGATRQGPDSALLRVQPAARLGDAGGWLSHRGGLSHQLA